VVTNLITLGGGTAVAKINFIRNLQFDSLNFEGVSYIHAKNGN